jgi:opacity protein-like surface antigen
MRRNGRFFLVALLVAGITTAAAQFKTQVQQESPAAGAIMRQDDGPLYFGWFDPSRFSMSHSVSFSYLTMGRQGMSVGSYTNSMMYQFSDKLNARADVSLMYSPFSAPAQFGGKSNNMSSIFLSRAEVNYKPWDNVVVQLQYRQIPWGYPSSSPFMNTW